MDELQYKLGARDSDQLASDIEEFWSTVETDDTLRAELQDADVPVDKLLSIPPSDAIQFEHRGAGIDPATVTLVVAFAPAVNEIVKSAWKEVILPWIRRRRGDDAVGGTVDE